MLSKTMRLTATLIAGLALSLGGIGVAQAKHGADDPPGHEQHHGGKHHHHGSKHHQHGANHDAGDDHGDDGPNHG